MENDDLLENNFEKNYSEGFDVKQPKGKTSVVPASDDTYSVNHERQLTNTDRLAYQTIPKQKTSSLVKRLWDILLG